MLTVNITLDPILNPNVLAKRPVIWAAWIKDSLESKLTGNVSFASILKASVCYELFAMTVDKFILSK